MALKIGDKVNFEYAPDITHPRIDLGKLGDPSGVFGEGVVIDTMRNKFVIEYTASPGTKMQREGEVWQFNCSDAGMPGFPTKIISPEEVKNINALHSWLNNIKDG